MHLLKEEEEEEEEESGSRVTVIGRLYRETDTVLKKLLILIKY